MTLRSAVFAAACACAAARPGRALAEAQARIVGGSAVVDPRGTYPWMVKFTRFGSTGVNYCSGTMVSPTTVLTAAHCLLPASTYVGGVVQIGRQTVQDWCSTQYDLLDGSECIVVAAWTAHPAYTSVLRNDIAVLFLQRASEAPPVQLDWAGAPPVAWTALAMGYGKTSVTSTTASRTLMHVKVPLGTDASCASVWGSYYIAGEHICAGARSRSACQGDSGGPLMALADTTGWIPTVQLGVTRCVRAACSQLRRAF